MRRRDIVLVRFNEREGRVQEEEVVVVELVTSSVKLSIGPIYYNYNEV